MAVILECRGRQGRRPFDSAGPHGLGSPQSSLRESGQIADRGGTAGRSDRSDRWTGNAVMSMSMYTPLLLSLRPSHLVEQVGAVLPCTAHELRGAPWVERQVRSDVVHAAWREERQRHS